MSTSGVLLPLWFAIVAFFIAYVNWRERDANRHGYSTAVILLIAGMVFIGLFVWGALSRMSPTHS
jgi:nitric oxide reductase large subunit